MIPATIGSPFTVRTAHAAPGSQQPPASGAASTATPAPSVVDGIEPGRKQIEAARTQVTASVEECRHQHRKFIAETVGGSLALVAGLALCGAGLAGAVPPLAEFLSIPLMGAGAFHVARGFTAAPVWSTAQSQCQADLDKLDAASRKRDPMSRAELASLVHQLTA